jgi:tetratricopeptide (TPR) repeat protein
VDFYLKGRFYWNKRTPESLNQALEAFTQAIARDPNYSDAYVGLADSYNLLREFSAMPGNEAYFKAFAAAKKAVELDQQSSEAHASLGFVTFCGHRQKRPLLAVAAKIRQASELWELKHHLTQLGKEIDRKYEHKYSTIVLSFADLVREGRLAAEDLRGLSEDELGSIRQHAAQSAA